MSRAPQDRIALPVPYVKQIRAIAAAENQTITGVIGDLIRSKIADGVIPAELPGFDVEASESEIKIVTADGFEVALDSKEGRDLANALRQRNTVKLRVPSIHLERANSGLRLVSPVTGQKHPVSPSVASDLGDFIARKIDDAEKKTDETK
ncbi:hypothetical protein [Mangrovicoccus ximenensis]|uniref:hypothetical protein n=1 Tax=Mangrovicoccus ximenensis TaxID=1911570 RepID=UPI000D36B877|nr:hypothetical protein [Mangrovicoccus ximenensis]